jgi:hypothetical protein
VQKNEPVAELIGVAWWLRLAAEGTRWESGAAAIARHTTTSTRITCTDSTRCDRPAQSGRLFHEQLIHHSSSAQASARVAAVEPVMNANASKRVRQYWRSICRRSRSLMYGFSCGRAVSSRQAVN